MQASPTRPLLLPLLLPPPAPAQLWRPTTLALQPSAAAAGGAAAAVAAATAAATTVLSPEEEPARLPRPFAGCFPVERPPPLLLPVCARGSASAPRARPEYLVEGPSAGCRGCAPRSPPFRAQGGCGHGGGAGREEARTGPLTRGPPAWVCSPVPAGWRRERRGRGAQLRVAGNWAPRP